MKAPAGIETALWTRIVAEARARTQERDPAHDFFHVERVVANAITIAKCENVGDDVEAAAVAAALLHELFTLPKSHPDSSLAGDKCAARARELLECEGAPVRLVEPICTAIRDHSFSKGVVPHAVAARLLQDADRLDAIGAIGLARMWSTCASMQRPFYSPDDPFCDSRAPDDKLWGLDHVFKKLLAIPERLHTKTARELAEPRIAFLKTYVQQLRDEIL